MKAILHRLHSPDVSDLETYRPTGPDFALLVQAMIGPDDGRGEESFDFVVCTPGWLSDLARKSGCVLPRHHLIIDSYRLETIRSAISKVCMEAEGDDWPTLAAYIGRFGKWEFEDYRPVVQKPSPTRRWSFSRADGEQVIEHTVLDNVGAGDLDGS